MRRRNMWDARNSAPASDETIKLECNPENFLTRQVLSGPASGSGSAEFPKNDTLLFQGFVALDQSDRIRVEVALLPEGYPAPYEKMGVPFVAQITVNARDEWGNTAKLVRRYRVVFKSWNEPSLEDLPL